MFYYSYNLFSSSFSERQVEESIQPPLPVEVAEQQPWPAPRLLLLGVRCFFSAQPDILSVLVPVLEF